MKALILRRYFGPAVYVCATLLLPISAAASTPDAQSQEAAVALQPVRERPGGVSDEAAMVLTGTALIVIATVVRRAV